MVEVKDLIIIAGLALAGIALFYLIQWYLAYRKAKTGFDFGMAVARDERTQTGLRMASDRFKQFTIKHNPLRASRQRLIQAPRVLIDNLHRTEQRKLRKESRDFVKRTDPNWKNYSTLGKQRAITEEANRRLNPRHISVQFEHDLKREYDLINEYKRAGDMVRIPDLWREMKGHGYTRSEFERELFRLEKERTIEMQTASQPRFIPEYDRKLGIPHQRRGHLNYVVFRYDPRKPMRR